MRRAPAAADEGGGMAAGRGALLLTVAVVIGIVLLNAADEAPAGQPVVVFDDVPADTVPPDGATSVPPARTPAEVKVLAANGTRTKGAAGRVTEALKGAGYTVLTPVDAPKADATTVYFVAGYEREAQDVARVLGVAETAVESMPLPPPVSNAGDANVVVVIGPELAEGTTATTATTAAP